MQDRDQVFMDSENTQSREILQVFMDVGDGVRMKHRDPILHALKEHMSTQTLLSKGQDVIESVLSVTQEMKKNLKTARDEHTRYTKFN